MLKTVIKKGSYHDSVILMLLTNQISTIEGVNKVSIMMGTPANKDIYEQSGLATPELAEAGANDLVIVADVDNGTLLGIIENEMEEFFKKPSNVSNGEKAAGQGIRENARGESGCYFDSGRVCSVRSGQSLR